MIGPGKYDDLCTEIMKKVMAQGVIVIIRDGDKGSGFSCQGTMQFIVDIPNALRMVADQIEADHKSGRL